MIYTVDRKYADGRVATERREEWGASTASALADYKRTVTDNTWDGQGRAQRSLQRIWHFEGPSAGNAVTWSSTVFGYGDRKYSASTWSAGNSSSQPAITAPVLTHEQEFVIDSRGTVINTRDLWPQIGNDKIVTVTFHPNGVEASESWSGWFYPYPHEDGQTILFDDGGNPVQDDSFSFRVGWDKAHVTSTYEQGRLLGRRIETGYYSDWPGQPMLAGAVIIETYTYNGAQLDAVDSNENDAKCTISESGQSWVSNCTWSPGRQLHTAYAYDSAGNLTERVVTDASGNELSRYTAVSDADGNLFCERQTQAGALVLFNRYDYSCW